MANLNKVMLIGRLTRDVEVRAFSNGGKVAKFGFAVSGSRKKNAQTGKWEDEPCFLDVEVFNRGEFSKKADTAEQYLSKGKQIFIEGKLTMQSWTSVFGNNEWIASGKPFNPSTHAMNISSTPRFFKSVNT